MKNWPEAARFPRCDDPALVDFLPLCPLAGVPPFDRLWRPYNRSFLAAAGPARHKRHDHRGRNDNETETPYHRMHVRQTNHNEGQRHQNENAGGNLQLGPRHASPASTEKH